MSKENSSQKISVQKKLDEIFWGIRKNNKKNKSKIDFSKLGNFNIKEGQLDGKEIERAIFYLRGKGCEWALRKNGGCFNCGHYAGTSHGKQIVAENFIKQFKDKFNSLEISRFPLICIYNAGSFLNDKELPNDARREILRIAANNDHVRAVILESRPEYITRELIDEVENILQKKRVEIGVGLELTNDFLRDLCVNKGFDLEDYKKCASLLHNSKLHLLTYILVKPLFLTIDEAIDEAIKTAKMAHQCGTDIISLEPISIQKGTLTEFFYINNKYELPTGWDLIEILKEINDLPIEIRIGGFEYFPKPKIVVSNCPHCREKLNRAIEIYNKRRELEPLLSLQCVCKKDWEYRRTKEASIEKDITNRVSSILNHLEI